MVLTLLFNFDNREVRANVIYNWKGSCDSGCIDQATAVLTLADTYTPGTALATIDFISFDYFSNSLNYSVPPVLTVNVSGILPAVGPEAADVNLLFSGIFNFFETSTSPESWLNVHDVNDITIVQEGSGSLWMLATVPEPSTMLLLGSGLTGLIGFSRRSKKS
jgi:hypothetical protein